jgi:hypothetical protein
MARPLKISPTILEKFGGFSSSGRNGSCYHADCWNVEAGVIRFNGREFGNLMQALYIQIEMCKNSFNGFFSLISKQEPVIFAY